MSHRDSPLPPDADERRRQRGDALDALAPWSEGPPWEIVLWYAVGVTMLAVGDSTGSHFWTWLGFTFAAWGTAKLKRVIGWAVARATGLDVVEEGDRDRGAAPVAPSPLLAAPLAQANAGVLAILLGTVAGLRLGLESGDPVPVPAGAALGLCIAAVTVGAHMAVRGLTAWLRGDDLRDPSRPPGTPW